jgi:TetR/AcrR family transcriptional repressor of nem operon
LEVDDFMGRVSDARERLLAAVIELIWTGSYGSTTVDSICEKAGVKKGSFYHFFKSKAELAAAALDADWEKHQAELDRVFSVTVPPLERLERFCEQKYKSQAEWFKKYGYVLGCPLCAVGAEVSGQDQILRAKIDQIMGRVRQYFECTIRDAHAEGSVRVRDVQAVTNILFAYMEGLLTQARIQNNLKLFKGLSPGIMTILGVGEKVKRAA